MRLQQQRSDFNKVNDELKAVRGINDVDGRFIRMASNFWWAYRIAYEWNLNPREVKTWPAEEVLEALAAIGMAEKNQKKKPPK